MDEHTANPVHPALRPFDRPELHNICELVAAIVVNMIATVLKIGAVLLPTSLVADLQLVAAAHEHACNEAFPLFCRNLLSALHSDAS